MPSPGRSRIECIGNLRCLAATLVVLYHTDLQVLRLSGGQHIHAFGFSAAGTDLLFVISGFIMVYITRSDDVRFGEFVLRRVARLAPLYWSLTFLMLAAFLAVPGLFHTTSFVTLHFLASLAFLPYPHPILAIQRPFLFPGWALNYFMFFYLLFGLFLFLPTKRRIATVGLILCTLTLLRLLFFGVNPVLDFVLGMAVAWVYLERNAVGPMVIAVALAISAAIFVAGVVGGVAEHTRSLCWGLADAGLLFSCLFVERECGWWSPGLVKHLGEASFAIYLSNLFTLAIVTKTLLVTGLFPILGLAGSQILLLASALAAGLLVHVVVERPLQALSLRVGGRLLQGARRFGRSAAAR